MDERANLTPASFNIVVKLLPNSFRDTTVGLMWAVLKLSSDMTIETALRFVSRLSKFNDEQVSHGLGLFFAKEYHLKGYEWQWAAGMVAREGRYKANQLKNKLSGIPREK